jgi:predicted aspartyl protease
MPTLTYITARGDKKSKQVSVLVDTGATVSFIREDVAQELATLTPLPEPLVFTLADGSLMRIDHFVSLTLMIAGKAILDTFLVMPPSGVEEVVLGEATMRKFGLKLDFETGSISTLQLQEFEPQLAAFITTTNHDASHTNMRKETSMINEMLARIFARLNIPVSDSLTDEDAINMIVDRARGFYSMVATEDVLTMLGLPKDAKESEVKGAILALQHPGNVVSIEQHNAVVAKLETLEREHFLSIARAEGKVTPAEMAEGQPLANLYKDDFPTFKAFVEKRGKQIPLTAKQPEPPPASAVSASTGTAGERLTALAFQIKEKEHCSFAEALRLAQRQHPDLAQQHLEEMRA